MRETWAYAIAQVSDRSGLVAVPVLAARFLRQAPSPRPEDIRSAARSDLRGIGSRQHRRRLDVLAAAARRVSRLNAARKWTMLLCAVLVMPVVAASYVDNLWVAVAIVALAAAAHQGFSCNLFTSALRRPAAPGRRLAGRHRWHRRCYRRHAALEVHGMGPRPRRHFRADLRPGAARPTSWRCSSSMYCRRGWRPRASMSLIVLISSRNLLGFRAIEYYR